MNAEHLEALVIDQSLGELPPDVSALLDAYLGSHPEHAREAQRIREAVSLTGQTMDRHPELVRETDQELATPDFMQRLTLLVSFLQSRAAFVSLAVLVAALVGFWAGQGQSAPASPAAPELAAEHSTNTERKADSPWARYDLDDLEPSLAAVVGSVSLDGQGGSQ